MSKKVLLWGIGRGYESLINAIRFEIEKKNMLVEAVVCKESDRYCNKKDGFDIITKDEISNYEYDYIIVTATHFFKEIVKEAVEIGVDEKKIINGAVFWLALFDFKRYASLIENPVTILSDDCWGGYAYNRLNLPFSSPLINIYWDRDDYAKFIEKPFFYLDADLQMEREGDIEKGIYPIGRLGTDTDSVLMNFTHTISFAEAKKQWNRRKVRINNNNIFVKMGFFSNTDEEALERYVSVFNRVPYNKVLFYNGSYNNAEIKEQIVSNRFMWRQKSGNFVTAFEYSDYLRAEYYWDLDLLKLLNGDGDFSRYN